MPEKYIKSTCFITLVALNLDTNLFSSTKKHKTNELCAEVALCNLQGYMFGLEEINCTDSPIRGLTAMMGGWVND